ncbi:MAG: hypothetical protein Q4G69_09785 [Planctomycetia bacterium]|nr:hypothetical protein [Planctomycetia bacterium]
MFWEERAAVDDFLIPGRDMALPENKLDFIEYLKHLLDIHQDKSVKFVPFEKEYSLRNLSLPLSDEKNFEEYSIDDEEDDPFDDDPFDLENEFDENGDEKEDPWEQDDSDSDEDYDIASDEKVPYSYIKKLRNEIHYEGNLSKRNELAIAIARYVVEQYANIKAEKSRELLNEAKSILAELISEGETEYCIHYARLLNEIAFIEFVFPKGEFVSMSAVQESIKYLQEILGSGLAEESEILEQMNGAWRIQADSFERNGAINSALAARLREEDLREKMLQNGDIDQLRELAVVYSAIASNKGALGDYSAALDKYRQADEIWGNHLDEWNNAVPERFNTVYRIAMTLHHLNRESEAVAFMEERADAEREYVNGKEEKTFHVYGNHLQIRADFYLWLDQFDRFLELEKEIILLYEKLGYHAKENLISSLGSCFLLLADTYKVCGYALHTTGENELAYSIFDLGMNFAWAAEHWFNIDTRPLMIDIGARYAAVLGTNGQYEKTSTLIALLIALIEQLIEEDPNRVISIYPRLLHHYAHIKTLLEENDDTALVLDKCIKYWENIVIDQGKLGWREAYAASLGERGTFYVNAKNDYEKALYDFSKAASIMQEVVEDDEDYSRLPLYIAVISDKGNALDKLGRKSEALPVVLALFDYMTNLYLKKKIRLHFDRYYDLGLTVVRYYFSVNGANRAIEEMERIIDNFEKIKREFLRDPDFDVSEIVDILEYTLFTFRLVKTLGLCEDTMEEQAYIEEIRNLHKIASGNILKGKVQYVEKDVMVLEKFFILDSKGKHCDDVLSLLQNFLNEILQAFESSKLEWKIEYEPLFKLYANFCDAIELPAALMDSVFELRIRFAALGKEQKVPGALLLYCSCLEDKIVYLFKQKRVDQAKKYAREILDLAENPAETDEDNFLVYKGIACHYMGRILQYEHASAKAQEYLRKAIRVFRQIEASNPDYTKNAIWGASSYYLLASILEDQKEAFSCLETALEIFHAHRKEETDDKSMITFNIVNTLFAMGNFCIDPEIPELYDPQAALKNFLDAEEHFDQLDLDSRDKHCNLLFRIWAGIFSIADLQDDRKIVDDLASKISIWEIAFPEVFSDEDARFLCALKFDIAQFYVLEAYPKKVLRIIEEVLNIHSKFVHDENVFKLLDSFMLRSYSLKLWASSEIGDTEDALHLAEFFHDDSRQYFRYLVREIKKGNKAVKEFINDYFSNYRKILYYEALCRYRLGDPKGALKILGEKIILESWTDPDRMNVGRLSENIFRAECLLALKKYAKAQNLLDATIARLKNAPSMSIFLSDALYWRAVLCFKKQEYESAFQDICSAVDILKKHLKEGKKQAIYSCTEFMILKIRICSAYPEAGEDLKVLFEEAENFWKLAIKEGRSYYKNLALDLKEVADLLK